MCAGIHVAMCAGLAMQLRVVCMQLHLSSWLTCNAYAFLLCSCRQTQDEFAAASHRKAAAAQAAGKFQAEIVPVHTKVKDPTSGTEQQVTISADDGIRPGTTAASLAGLRTVFKKDGTTTAGNSSQVSRLMAVLGWWLCWAAWGLPERMM
jgi:acetyl-CoA acetyltransferase